MIRIAEQEMKPLVSDCSDKNWKSFVKRNPEDGIEVIFDNFDFAVDG